MKKNILLLAISSMMVLLLASCGMKKDESAVSTTENDVVIVDTDEDEAMLLYEYEEEGSGISIKKYLGTSDTVYIPSELDNKKVVKIGESAFSGNMHLTRVIIPEGVTEISDYAFECCSALQKVYLPDSLIKIGNGAFSGCADLRTLDMQNGVKEIGDGAFMSCMHLYSFEAPEELEKIGAFAFSFCKNLYYVDLSKCKVLKYSDRLFYQCEALRDIRVSYDFTDVGEGVFMKCKNLTSLYFPDTVERIGANACRECVNLRSVTLPPCDIEEYAFKGCESFEYLTLHEGTKSIASGAFMSTPIKPESFTLPENAVVSSDAFDFPLSEIGKEEEYVEEEEYIEEEYVEEEYVEEEYVEEEYVEEEYVEEDVTEEPVVYDPYDVTPEGGKIVKAKDLEEEAGNLGFKVVPNENFDEWAEGYISYNQNNAVLSQDQNIYITMYKGQIDGYYHAMTAVASKDPADLEKCVNDFGKNFEAMFTMVNHGLRTEMGSFKMSDDMLLYTGVYDCQLMAITGGDTVPSLEELENYVGKTFTDPCLTSTSFDVNVAKDFGDTIFVIRAKKENMDAVGSVCMDSYMHTFEKETLLYSGCTYEIKDVGYMEIETLEEDTVYRKFILLDLINE